MSTIAFLGTGLLGSGFIEAAAGRGDRVTVWNRTAEKAHALTKFGVTVAASPVDAVRGAERVHLVLKDDAVVESVIKALRVPAGLGWLWRDIEVTRTSGPPSIRLTGRALERATALGVLGCHLSLSHSATHAVAIVVLV